MLPNKYKHDEMTLCTYLCKLCLNPTCILFPVSLLLYRLDSFKHLICKRYRSSKYIPATIGATM